jgi:Ser/Thr protein kinase RdoA (MazF antagonist)
MAALAEAVPELLTAFGLTGPGRFSDGPVASGRLGSIWRLETGEGSWAVKQVDADASAAEIGELADGAAFQDAAVSAGVPAPGVRRTAAGDVLAEIGGLRVRLHAWVDLEEPAIDLDPVELGQLVAALHRVDYEGAIGVHPWYTEPVGPARWAELVAALRARRAPFADELDALVPELVALEGLLGGRPRSLRTCHRDLWADNVRRTPSGGLCVFDFDNAGLADPGQELALVLVEYGDADPQRSAAIREAYADAGGPGRVVAPTDFAMPIAQLAHILEEGCRRWLIATTEAGRADNEAWVRELIDRPLARSVIEALLEA